jgi:hypothetical protein
MVLKYKPRDPCNLKSKVYPDHVLWVQTYDYNERSAFILQLLSTRVNLLKGKESLIHTNCRLPPFLFCNKHKGETMLKESCFPNVLFHNRLFRFLSIIYKYCNDPGEITPSYILHTRAFKTYLLRGLFTLKKDNKVVVFYM